MFDNSDYDRIDPRTGYLRCGMLVQTTIAGEALKAMSLDIEMVLQESDYAESYFEGMHVAIRLDIIGDLASKGPLAGLPQMDGVADAAIIEGMEFLDQFCPLGTYYGWHRDSSDCLGVWLDWTEIDKAAAEGKLNRPDGVWAYVRIGVGTPEVKVFNATGDEVANDQAVEDAAYDGRVFEISAGTTGYYLFEMEDDMLVSINATVRQLVFAA